MSPALEDAARAARDWLIGPAASLWTGAGFDAGARQFVEAVSRDGEPLASPRRTLVQARQMYMSCVCGHLGWTGPWRERATAVGETLLKYGRNGRGDWVFSLRDDSQADDPRADLYTQAFVIFGLAEAGAALGRADFVAAAEATANRLDAGWTHPLGGFREGEIRALPRRQNPHMHLLEAYLALHAATGARAHLARAEAIAALFTRRLRLAPGRLGEFFEDDWRAVDPVELSPGHHFEWAWLLDRLRAAGGEDLSEDAAALSDFAERHGVNAAGFVIDAVSMDGRVQQPTSRLWPQTERLKAALARGDAAAAQASIGALSAYLDQPTRGLWADTRTAEGGWKPGPAPASSGYHIACAIERLVEATGVGAA